MIVVVNKWYFTKSIFEADQKISKYGYKTTTIVNRDKDNDWIINKEGISTLKFKITHSVPKLLTDHWQNDWEYQGELIRIMLKEGLIKEMGDK